MAVYSYTTDSIEPLEDLISYGSLLDSPAEIIDAGSIAVSVVEVEDSGYITTILTTYPFGSKNFSGKSNSSFVRSTISTKSNLALTSKITEGINFVWVGSGTLFEIGGGQERIVAPWVGSSGPLRIVGLSFNNGTYNYQNFVTVQYTADDYGSVFSAVSLYKDYGFIQNSGVGLQDNGSITTILSETSFNTALTFYGESFVVYKPIFAQFGSGSLFALRGSSETVSLTNNTIGLFNITGSSSAFTASSYVGSGRIFAINSKEEKLTYNYTDSSIVNYQTEDYGFVSSPASSVEDYKNVNSIVSQGEINYGYITTTTTDYPLDVLFKFTGESVVDYRPTFAQIGSGTLFALSGSAKTVAFASDSTVLFAISGSTEYNSIKVYSGSGSLFAISDKEEKVTYNYNKSSITYYSEEDYGFVASVVSSEDDYGLVDVVATLGEINYGYITTTTTDYPLDVLFKFTGESSVDYRPTFAQIGSGTLFALSGSAETVAFANDTTALFNIIGSTEYRTITSYNGFGSLFTISEIEERVTYNYNKSSIVYYSEDDYEFVASLVSTEDDYGSIDSLFVDVTTNYGYITTTTTDYPLDVLFKFTGESSVDYRPSLSQIGSGTLFAFGGSAETIAFSSDSTVLFAIIGSTEYNSIRTQTGSGSLFTIGDKEEKVTYNYNKSSIVYYSEEDYGFISSLASSEDDYGFVDSISTLGEINYGYITTATTEYPLDVLFKFTGECLVSYEPVFTQIGSGTLFALSGSAETVAFANDTTILFNISGSTEYSRIKTYNGSGSLFTISDNEEKITYNYNKSSIVYYSEDDYGFVASVVSAEDDYGFINSEFVYETTNYGYITTTTTDYPLDVIFKFTGETTVDYRPSLSQIGSGTLFAFGGSAETVAFANDTTALFNIIGFTEYNSIRTQTGSGSLFTIGDKEERVTYNYNKSSIVYYSEDDYEFVASVVSAEDDYGFVNDVATLGEINYGYITINAIDYPLDVLFKFTGESSVSFEPVFTQIGSGTLFAFGGSAETVAFANDTTALFNIIGSTEYSRIRTYNGSGSLFTISDNEEKVTYNYNKSSIVYYSEDDYGFVASTVSTEDDYGFIDSEFVYKTTNYGYITTTTTDYPLDVIFKFTGESSVEYRPTFAQFGFGTLFAFGGSAETVAFANDTTALFNIIGSTEYRTITSYNGSGSLFTIGDKEERVTYNYNKSSIVYYSEEDYGFVASLASSEDDYGFIDSVATLGEINYGYITTNAIDYPLDVIFKFTGQSQESFNKGLYTGSGSLFTLVSGVESSVITKPDSIQLFTIYGESTEKYTNNYVGSGSLFAIGDKEERVTYNYNKSSIVYYSEEDYGFVASIIVSDDDYGFIDSEFVSETTNYGYITTTTTDYPLDVLFKFTGESSVSFEPVFTQIGSGTLFAFGGSAETVAFANDTTALFNIGGSAEFNTTRPYNASGSLFTISDNEEKVTYNYNKSSIVYYSEDDYGFVASVVSSEDDYEFIDSEFVYERSNYGYITTTTTDYPLDVIFKFTGTSAVIYNQVFTQIGSGSLVAFNGSADSIAIVNDTFGLFAINGSSEYRVTRYQTGSGSLFTIGDKEERVTYNYNKSSIVYYSEEDYEFISSLASSEDNYGFVNDVASLGEINYGYITTTTTDYPFGGFKLAGEVSDIQITSAYRGSGSLFALQGSAESRTVDLPESTTLFKILGECSESFTEGNYDAFGSIFTDGSVSDIKLSYANNKVVNISISGEVSDIEITSSYRGSGTLFAFQGSVESRGIDLPESTTLFKIFGGAKESFSEGNYDASGSIFTDGSVSDIKLAYANDSIVNIFISGEVSDIQITSAYRGSGSLFALQGSAESRTVDLPESTTLFKIFGGAKESFTEGNYDASGSIFTDGSVSDIKLSYANNEVLDISISGEVSDIQITSAYRGSGSLFALQGSSESRGIDLPESIGLFRIGGSKLESYSIDTLTEIGNISIGGGLISEKHTESYVGSGSTSISGVSTAKLLSNNIGFGSIYLQGSVVEKQLNVYVGSGNLFAISGSIESITADISIVASPFRFSGASVEKHTENYVGSGSSKFDGTAVLRSTGFIIGSGSLFAFNGSGESYTISEVPTGLFKISGSKIESVASSVVSDEIVYNLYGNSSEESTRVYTGIGSAYIDGISTNVITNSFVGTGSIISNGTVVEKQSDSYVGSGSLFALVGSTKAITISTVVSTIFSISGTATEKHTESYVGSGNTTLRGASTSKFVGREIVSGSINVYGDGTERQTDSYVGSGVLFGFLGSVESVTIDQPEVSVLFNLYGTATEKNTENYVGSGTKFISGASTSVFAPSWKGSGSAFIIVSGKESHTESYVGYVSTEIFGFATNIAKIVSYEGYVQIISYGKSIEKNTESYVGSGSLFSGFESTSSVSYIPKEPTGIFKISGVSDNSRGKTYTGSGTIFKFNGSSESYTISERTTGLFVVSGTSVLKFSGSHVGSGTLFGLSGSTESIAYTPAEFDTLFTVGGSSTSSVAKDPVEDTAQYIVSGGFSDIKLSYAHLASGSLFGFNGSVVVASPSFVSSKFEGIVIKGALKESYSRASYVATGSQNISGDALTEYRLYQPVFTYIDII
jgi:hypothetical protein